MVWYSDFGNQFAGEHRSRRPARRPTSRSRCSSPSSRRARSTSNSIRQGNLWLAMMYQAGIAQDRPQDQRSHDLSVPEGMAVDLDAGLDGVAAVLRRRRQGLDQQPGDTTTSTGWTSRPANSRTSGPSKDPDGKQISAYGMPTDPQNNLYQLEFGGTQHRPARRQDRAGHDLSDADAALAAAPRPGRSSRTGCGSPNTAATPSACSIRRPATIKEYKLPTPVEPALRRGAEQGRERSVDRLDAHRPGRPPRHQDRPVHRISAAAADQYPPRLRAGDRPAADPLGRQQPRRRRSSRSSRSTRAGWLQMN